MARHHDCPEPFEVVPVRCKVKEHGRAGLEPVVLIQEAGVGFGEIEEGAIGYSTAWGGRVAGAVDGQASGGRGGGGAIEELIEVSGIVGSGRGGLVDRRVHDGCHGGDGGGLQSKDSV